MFKLLGVWQQDNPCWNYHVEQTLKKASKRLYFLMECRKANLPTEIDFVVVSRRAIDCLADINRCLKVQTFYIVSATIYS